METKKDAKTTPEGLPYLTIDLSDNSRYQPIHASKVYESYIGLTCKFDTEKINKKLYKLNSVDIKLKRFGGLVNMALYRVSGIERGINEKENEVKILVDLEIYTTTDQYTYLKTNGFEIKKGDYLTVEFENFIGIEVDDLDISNGPSDRQGFCDSKVIFDD